MTRPTVEVADIFRAQGSDFVYRHRHSIRFQQLKVMRAIVRCRTAALGGHRDKCMHCGLRVISFNSCRNRHCPKCQAQARKRWIAARGE
jgi:predicted Zn-ribbon and HTH transcriptional regulator